MAEAECDGVRAAERAPAPVKHRMLYLDNLKVFLISLVIIHHAGQPYGSYAGDWPIHQVSVPQINELLLGWLFTVDATFFMGLFFLVSAYFLPKSFDRKGAIQYIKDRLLRLGLPIPLLVLLAFPLVGFLVYSGNTSLWNYLTGVYFNFAPGGTFTFGYLWFVVWLLVFSCGYAIYLVLTNRLPRPSKKLAVPGHIAIIGFAAVLAAASFLVRIWFPSGDWIFYHLLEPARLPQYALLFTIGILAYRNDWIGRMPWKTAKIWGLVAVVAIIGFPVLYLAFGDPMWTGGISLPSLALCVWEAFLGTGLAVALPVFFRERLNFQGKILKTMSLNVYPVYLIHVPLLIGLQAALQAVNIPPLLKFALVAILGIPLCFLTSEYLIRKIPHAQSVL